MLVIEKFKLIDNVDSSIIQAFIVNHDKLSKVDDL